MAANYFHGVQLVAISNEERNVEKKIDWSKAPEWATAHGVCGSGPVYAAWLGETHYQHVRSGKKWRYVEGWARYEFRDVVERPAAPAAPAAPAVDWSGAPERATHYFIDSPQPWRDCSGKTWWWLSDDGDWKDSQESSAGILERRSKDMVQRPAPAPAWPAEGVLPPVGTVCEYRRLGGNSWQKVKILVHFDASTAPVAGFIPVEGMPHIAQAIAACFRPIKTAEQIAAEAREKALDEMTACTSLPVLYAGPSARRAIAAQLYDAGYRKQ